MRATRAENSNQIQKFKSDSQSRPGPVRTAMQRRCHGGCPGSTARASWASAVRVGELGCCIEAVRDLVAIPRFKHMQVLSWALAQIIA